MVRCISLVGLVLLVGPKVAWAQATDAGADAGLDDAGADAAPTGAEVPDASAGDVARAECLDGYDHGAIEVCAGKEPGAACTFNDGSPGACAHLRCGGNDVVCVSTQGQPAPPPVQNLDASADGDELGAEADEAELLAGGGCRVGSPAFAGGELAGVGLIGLLGVFLRRRR